MKNVKILFAALIVFISVVACAPNHEEVIPSNDNQEETPFNVKSTEDSEGPNKPTPR